MLRKYIYTARMSERTFVCQTLLWIPDNAKCVSSDSTFGGCPIREHCQTASCPSDSGEIPSSADAATTKTYLPLVHTKGFNQHHTHLIRYPSCLNSLLAVFNYMDPSNTKWSTSASRNKPPSRPSTPLRPSSRTSIRDGQTITPKTGPTAFPLESLEPAFAEFADSMADLEANFMHLQLMHESLSRFNESFASFLYGMNMNAFCVDFPEVRGFPSQECSGTEAL